MERPGRPTARADDPDRYERTEVIARPDPRAARRGAPGGTPPERRPGGDERRARHQPAGRERGDGAPGDARPRGGALRSARAAAQQTWANLPATSAFQDASLNVVTQTMDLSALRRRMLEDAEADAAGQSRPPGTGDAEGTQLLQRPAAGRRRQDAEGTQLLFRDADGTRLLYRDLRERDDRAGRHRGKDAPAPARGRDQGARGPAPDDLGLADLDADPGTREHARALQQERDGEVTEAPVEHGTARSRAIWTLFDQLISSGTNSVLMFVVAHAVTKSEFGAFSIAFAIFSVVIGFSKAAGGQPLGIRYAGASPTVFTAAASRATGSAFVLGLLVGVGCALIGVALGGSVGSALVTLGVVLPGLLVQDLWRQVFFAQGRPAAAAVNDSVWAVVQVVGVGVLLHRHAVLASPMLLAWGASAAVAALIGVAQAGFWPSPARALDWVREHRDINGYLAAEFVTIQGALNASLLIIGALELSLVGALRGVQTLLGPTTIFAVGLVSWSIPEFSRRKDMAAPARMKAAYVLSAAVVALGLVWGLIFLVFGTAHVGGQEIGRYLLGDTWEQTHHILALSLVQQAGAAATVGVSCMLIALGQAKHTFRLNVIAAPQLLLYPVIGMLVGGATGAVIGFVLANWVMVPFWYRLLRRAARETDQERDALARARDDETGRARRASRDRARARDDSVPRAPGGSSRRTAPPRDETDRGQPARERRETPRRDQPGPAGERVPGPRPARPSPQEPGRGRDGQRSPREQEDRQPRRAATVYGPERDEPRGR